MRTGIGTFPLRKPGILTACARSDAACSTACWTSACGTSTRMRTRFSATSSSWVSIRPLQQSAFGLRPSSLGRMRLYVLVRHAQSVLNVERRINGDPSVPAPLTEAGRAEARLLGIQLAHVPLERCVYTRFERTRETATLA